MNSLLHSESLWAEDVREGCPVGKRDLALGIRWAGHASPTAPSPSHVQPGSLLGDGAQGGVLGNGPILLGEPRRTTLLDLGSLAW